jgi:hypothetical protein
MKKNFGFLANGLWAAKTVLPGIKAWLLFATPGMAFSRLVSGLIQDWNPLSRRTISLRINQ